LSFRSCWSGCEQTERKSTNKTNNQTNSFTSASQAGLDTHTLNPLVNFVNAFFGRTSPTRSFALLAGSASPSSRNTFSRSIRMSFLGARRYAEGTGTRGRSLASETVPSVSSC
jgi:hypothetical protein